MTNMKEKIRISIQLKAEVHEKLKKLADSQGTTMSSLVVQMVNQNVNILEQVNQALSDPVKLAEMSKVLGYKKETD